MSEKKVDLYSRSEAKKQLVENIFRCEQELKNGSSHDYYTGLKIGYENALHLLSAKTMVML